MANPTAFHHSIDLVVGPLLIATTFNAFVYGICAVQFVTYWEHKVSDSTSIKFLVIWTFLIDTVHTCTLLYMLWVYVVGDFDNPSFLMVALWPFSTTPIATTLTSFPIQIYLSYRIRRFAKSDRIFVGLCALSAAQASLGVAVSADAYRTPDLATYSRLIPLVDTWQAAAVITDLCLTIFLWYYLSKSRTGQRKSDNVITRIISLSIETAAVGAFFCIMDLITFTALLDTNFHVIFGFPMGRIYTNILLMTLNSRSSLRAELEGPMLTPDIMFNQSARNASTIEHNIHRAQDNFGPISVNVNVFNATDLSRAASNTEPWQDMQHISTSVLAYKEVDLRHNLDRV